VIIIKSNFLGSVRGASIEARDTWLETCRRY